MWSDVKVHFELYIEVMDRYQVIPSDRKSVFRGPQHGTQDPTRRRESKIAQYKMEREIKGKLEVRSFFIRA
jgi:immunoglobulin-binding protein 1